jgi:FkbM family methyltransferase
MSARNNLILLLRRLLDALEVRLVNLKSDKVRGIDPLRDLGFLLAHKSDPIVFDVGANDGETAQEILHAFPRARLFAFEPYAACCDELARKFGTNANVTVHNLALGAARCTTELNLYSGNRMNSLLSFDDDPANPMSKSFTHTGTAKVSVEALDDYCVEQNIPRIDLLKVDTQGYDLQVLKGATKLLAARRIKTVLLEVNFVPMYQRQATFLELHAFISSFGYRLVDFYNQQRSDGYTAWGDACYVATSPR